MKSKAQLVLEKLEIAGEQGVFSFDLANVGGWRYAARINDLKKSGHEILSLAEKRGRSLGCRYILIK